MRAFALLALAAIAACVQPAPAEREPVVDKPAQAGPDQAELDRRRARVREQFEAASRGERHRAGSAHSPFNCPHCVDPLRGVIPDEALIDGPAAVWN